MGTRKTAQDKRSWFQYMFSEADKMGVSLSEKKLIAQFCLKFSSTQKTGKEIVNHFIDAEIIYRLKGDLMSPKLYKEVCKDVNKREF